MIRPITYTYKGRPIAPFGKRKSARSPRRGRKIRSVLVAVFCVILILAAAAAMVWWLSSCFRTGPAPEEPVEEKNAANQPEETAVAASPSRTMPETLGDSSASVSSAVTGNKAKQVSESARLSESADRQALRIYSAATTAFQQKDYENARKALRLLFEKIQLPPGHPLYDRACSMLSECSMTLYRSGNDPQFWKIHKVERGENLSRIARKYGTDVQTITEVNGLTGTALRIGQTIRIPQGSWRIRIERKNKRLLLDGSGRLFKIYPVAIGPKGESAAEGLYRIRRQQSPNRILFLGTSSLPAAEIQSKEGGPDAGKACFVMEQADVAELLLLIPEKTPAEILK